MYGGDSYIYFVSDRGGHENVWSVRTETPAAANNVASAAAAPPREAKKDKDPDAGRIPPKTAVGSTDTEVHLTSSAG